MTDPTAKLWRIPKLRWEESVLLTCRVYTAVSQDEWRHSVTAWNDGTFTWRVGGVSGSCLSLSDGKAKCEALYRERMARGLEPVEGVGLEGVIELVDELVKVAKLRGTDGVREYPILDGRVQDARSALESAIRTLAGQERGE